LDEKTREKGKEISQKRQKISETGRERKKNPKNRAK